MTDYVKSTDDLRVTNNVMRHEYKVLSHSEKAHMQTIKDLGLELYTYIDSLAATSAGSRELSIAKTKIEEAIMWAVKHITK